MSVHATRNTGPSLVREDGPSYEPPEVEQEVAAPGADNAFRAETIPPVDDVPDVPLLEDTYGVEPAPTSVEELFGDGAANTSIADVTTLTNFAIAGEADTTVSTEGTATDVFSAALETDDITVLASSLQHIYSQDPDQLAELAVAMPDLFESMTPAQRAAVGSVMLVQGRQFEENYDGDYTQDPAWLAMASVQRAWGDTTAFAGLDPLGRTIDHTISTTGEDYATYRDEIQASQVEAADAGINLWTDMDLPYSMWTESGNIARYLGLDNTTYVGEQGLRVYGWSEGRASPAVTAQERDVAATVELVGDGVIETPDGNVVQTHMGLDQVVETGVREPGSVNEDGEWEDPRETTAENTQDVLPGFEHLVNPDAPVDATSQGVEEEVVAGNVPLPDAEASADSPQNQPYMQVLLMRAGIMDLGFGIGRTEFRLEGQTLTMSDLTTSLGLSGLTMSEAAFTITREGDQLIEEARASGLSLTTNGLQYSTEGTREVTNTDGTTENTGYAIDANATIQDGQVQGDVTVLDMTDGTGVGIVLGGATDPYGNDVDTRVGVATRLEAGPATVNAALSVQNTYDTGIIDSSNANGLIQQTAVENSGDDAILMVGQTRAIQGTAGVDVSNGTFGVGVEVSGTAGTGAYYFTAAGNVVAPDGSEVDAAWAQENGQALHELGEEVGWPELEGVFEVSDIDLDALAVGSGYYFTDFTANSAQVRGSAYGVGVSLGRAGQEYEAAMVTRTDDDTMRISVASMDEATWNAGIDLGMLPLYQGGTTEGNTTMVEFDLDMTTEAGQQAWTVFQQTGALPQSYDEAFAARAEALASVSESLALLEEGELDPDQQAALDEAMAALGPALEDMDTSTMETLSETERIEAQFYYAQAVLRGEAATANNEFLESPEYMEAEGVDGVQYAHRVDQRITADRQTLLGVANWGTTDVHTTDRLWIDGFINTETSLQRDELSFTDMLRRGEYGRERGGHVTNPHDGTYELGVFADVPLEGDQSRMLAELGTEDPVAQAYLNGMLDGVDPVAQVAVFLTENHLEVLDGAFDTMREVGEDPWSLVQEGMVEDQSLLFTEIAFEDSDENLLNTDAIAEEGAGFDTPAAYFDHVIQTAPEDFSTLGPGGQSVYIAAYLDTASGLDVNPYTALDFALQVEDPEQRALLMDQIATTIEREDDGEIDGSFELISLYEDIADVDPEAAELLQQGVFFTVEDREIRDHTEAAVAHPEAFQEWWLEGLDGQGSGVWDYQTDTLFDYVGWEAEGMEFEAWETAEASQSVVTALIAAEQGGMVDDFIGDLAEGRTPTELLEAMGDHPGYQALAADVLLRSGAADEVQAWIDANGVDIDVVLGGAQQDPAAIAEAVENGFDPARLLGQLPDEDVTAWLDLYAQAGLDTTTILAEATRDEQGIDEQTVTELAEQDPEALGQVFRDEEQTHDWIGSWDPRTEAMTPRLLAVAGDVEASRAFVESYLAEADRDRHRGDVVTNMLGAYDRAGSNLELQLAIEILRDAGYGEDVDVWLADR